MKYKNRLTFAYYSITFWDLKSLQSVPKIWQKLKEKENFLKNVQISKYLLLWFQIISNTILCWKYRFPTISFPQPPNTVLEIFISRPPANTTPPTPCKTSKTSQNIVTMVVAWTTFLGNIFMLLVQQFCGAIVNSCLLEYANVFPIKNKFSHLTSHFEFFWFSFSTLLSKMELLFLNLYTSPRWGTLKFKWFPSVKFWYTMWM